MTRARRLGTAALAVLAALTGFAVYQLQRGDVVPTLTGPPRSDYTLEQFELVTLDESGREAFAAEGPRLSRHPFLGTLSIEQPRMRFPDDKGQVWTSRADAATVSADADLVQLRGNVQVRGPELAGEQPPMLAGEALDLHPDQNRLASEAEVTLTGPGSILRGRALEAHLDTRRFDLSDVTGRYER